MHIFGAVFITAAFLLPAVLLSLTTRYIGLKFFCIITLIVQLFTVLGFYINYEKYDTLHRSFGFTALDVIPVIAPLGLFLFILTVLIKFSKPLDRIANINVNSSKESYTQSKKSFFYSSAILLIIIISIPVKLWMFSEGIGITGIEPPKLPYHISGILFYLFGYVMPLAMGALYLKTNRKSLTLTSIIFIFALFVGISSLSKGVEMLIVAPVLIFMLIDKRYGSFLFFGMLFLLSITIILLARDIVYISDGNTVFKLTDVNVYGVVNDIFQQGFSFDQVNFLQSIIDILDRLGGFKGLFLSNGFNAQVIGGSEQFLFKSIYHSFAYLDHDAIHQEFIGYTPPKGFYNVAANFNAYMLMATNGNLYLLPIFSYYAAIVILSVDRNMNIIARKYRIRNEVKNSIIFFTIIIFYTGPGTNDFFYIFILLVIARYVKKIR